MRKLLYLLLMVVNTLAVYAQEADQTLLDKTTNFSFFESKDFSMDFKFIDPSKGSFGIDYKVNLVRKLITLSKDTFLNKNLNLSLNSKGFITVTGNKNPNNSLISELKFEGFPLFYAKPKKITQPKENWEEVVDDPELIEKVRQLAKQASSPLWFFLNFHGKHETTQDFNNYDFALGSSLSVSSSYLNAILDAPFGLLRTESNNNPRQFDLAIGYDYVIGINKTAYAAINDSINATNRLNLKAEWETGIFTQRDRILFLFDSYYDLNSTQKMKDNKQDWNYFYMIRLDHRLNYNEKTKTSTKISIKYTQGALPPNFIEGYVIGGGFSVEF